MEKGFIMLSRKLFSHRIWKASRTFSECEAWIDLIQSARFEATVTIERIGGRDITYERGQYPASISFLAKRWGWKSEKKVRNFLDMLKKEGMITTDAKQGMNIITLCKYDVYNTPNNDQGEPKGKGEGIDIVKKIRDLEHALGKLTASIGTSVGQGEGNNNKKVKKEKKEKNNTEDSNESPVCGTSQPHAEHIDYSELVKFFNEKTQGVFGSIRMPLSDKRKGMINARIKTYGKETFAKMIQMALNSDFLKGQNKNGWRASFDWLIKPTNFEKVISGNYDNKNRTNNNAGDRDMEEFYRSIASGIARQSYEEAKR